MWQHTNKLLCHIENHLNLSMKCMLWFYSIGWFQAPSEQIFVVGSGILHCRSSTDRKSNVVAWGKMLFIYSPLFLSLLCEPWDSSSVGGEGWWLRFTLLVGWTQFVVPLGFTVFRWKSTRRLFEIAHFKFWLKAGTLNWGGDSTNCTFILAKS